MTHNRNKAGTDSFPSYSLRQRHLATIRTILDREFDGPDCKVYLFGSRARKAARSASDLDLAIQSSRDVAAPIARAQYALEESDLPYTVDLVELKYASPSLKREIQENGQLIWES